MAYAAVISLKNTIRCLKMYIDIPQITTSAYEELNSLGLMLKRLDDSSRSIDRSVIDVLDANIRDAAWKLEDVLESYVFCPPSDQGVDEKGVEPEFDSFMKTVKKLREEYTRELENPVSGDEDDAAVSPVHDDLGGNKSTTVGLADASKKIRNELLAWQCDLKIVSLVGMAGIGKTHLARDVYYHPLIAQNFDLRAWLSLGPKDQIKNIDKKIKNIFVDIVAQVDGKPRDVFMEMDFDTLRALFQNSLRGRNFLIVLDDIWSSQVLDYFRSLLPDYRNRSRLLLTTRLKEVSKNYWGSTVQQIPFLNTEESWDLLWQNVFPDQIYFPYKLEKAGRKIAELCEGLPLLILTVASILRGLDQTEEYWNKVAEKRTTTFTDAYDKIYEVLLPSYEYLPQHLKACFLYMGAFPQSFQIPLPKLIILWTIENLLEPTWYITLGFLEPIIYHNLEEIAMECLDSLVSKSLAIVCKWSFERVKRIKSCKLHSAYWHLCVKESRKIKFFHVLIKLTDVSVESQRRLSVQNSILFGLKEVCDSMAATMSTTRSLLFTGEDHQYPLQICLTMMMLKVLDALAIRFYEFPNEVVKLLQLRYLALTHNGELSCSISNLQHLQCLILRRYHNIKLLQRDSACLPEEIWDMQELNHVRIMGSDLPDPSKGAELPKLLTLDVNADSCTEAVFRSLPKLKRLGITIELQPGDAEPLRCLEHIGVLDRLESLKCVVLNPRLRSEDQLSNFPWMLKKLSLNGLGYSWEYMSVIASLPYLKVLKLRCYAFQGPHWEIEDGTFRSLQYLLLEDIDLQHWTAQKGGLRSLLHLTVRHCYKLRMIPQQIGNLPTLESMEVDECSPSVVDSAHQIKEKKKSSLQLEINSSWNL